MLSNLLFFLVLGCVLLIWGRMLWYLDEKSRIIQNTVFFMMRFSKSHQESIKSVILSILYYLFTVCVILSFAWILEVDVFSLLSFSQDMAPVLFLGSLTQMTLLNLSLGILIPWFAHFFRQQAGQEVRDVPWIQGILRSRNRILVVLIPGISGFFEEFFFRGILLLFFVKNMAFPPWLAIVLVTLAFVFQQLLQVKSAAQRLIIGSSCIIISLVGSLMVLITNSIIPAGLAHASFAIFYTQWSVQD